MWRALRLARRAYGLTSPNPMVGAVLVKRGQVIGEGWHHKAGQPHAEIEALKDAEARGHSPRGATLYVTLEPCSTHGRTPPCTEAIIRAGISTVVIGAVDPNPKHRGAAREILGEAGIVVREGVLAEQCTVLNESFNHWITTGMPFVTVKAAMTLDGKIATASGESKWITGERARERGMKLRLSADAILVGVNTILADDPSLTLRGKFAAAGKRLRRFVLDSKARTPTTAKVVTDDQWDSTTIVVTDEAPRRRIAALLKAVQVIVAPRGPGGIDLHWLMGRLGAEQVASLLVEGGGEVNGSFFTSGLAHRVAFFYAPMILGGRDSLRGVAGQGFSSLSDAPKLEAVRWMRLGRDWHLTARIAAAASSERGH